MPKSLLIDADRDTLRSSGETFAAELRAASTPVEHHVIRGTIHGFMNHPASPAFSRGIDLMSRWMTAQTLAS